MSKELEALGKIKETIIPSTRSNWETEYYYVGSIESTRKHFHIIEQALKRNEPTKVINGRTINGVCLDYYCPSCKQEIDNSEYSKDQYYLIKYCISCGQALDWGDKK